MGKTVWSLDLNIAVLVFHQTFRKMVLTNNGNDLTIESTGNSDENQAIIDVVNKAGGKIKSINEVTSSLEDVYIRLVEGEKK